MTTSSISYTKRRREEDEQELLIRSTTDVEPRQPPTLPMDLLLEIIARSDDVTTVVRCAAGCKPLRRAMLGPGFLYRLRRRAEANGGFDPSLLMAVSYRLPKAPSTGIVVQPPGRLRHVNTEMLLAESSEPLSSRDGLLVVRRHGILVVCNTITGHVTSLPSMGQQRTGTTFMYKPALLSIHGAGRSSELLVMYKHEGWWVGDQWGLRMLTQTFSSQEDKWGAMREINIHDLPNGVGSLMASSSSAPAIVEHNIHWLGYTRPTDSFACELIILALHAESAHASVIKLPQELHTRLEFCYCEPDPVERFILATTAATAQGERRLSLVVAEALVISMWTPELQVDKGSSISWSRQVVIRRREIGRPLVSVLDAYQLIQFSWFGERSGTVLFRMQGTGLVQLNLGTKKALVLWRGSDNAAPTACALHEINLISVLECMNSF